MSRKRGKNKVEVIEEQVEKDCQMKTEEKPNCMFCRTNTKNKYYLGKMMSNEDISAHYYCILFAPGLQQNGSLNDGFKGFLKNDIVKEVRRGTYLSCSYCRRKGAVIGCALNECNTKFHLNCGLVHDSFHNFHDPMKTFPSYCAEHRPIQRTARINNKSKDDVCVVCMDKVDKRPTPKTLWSPCCGHWMHRECVTKLAYHAAKHHFKCPNCNDNQVFVNEMKTFGVHVPSRDASWEKGQSFQDMYQKKYSCSAEKCLSKKGREYNGERSLELLACDGCGANAVHIKCAHLAINGDEWLCSLCKPILDTISTKKRKVLNDN